MGKVIYVDFRRQARREEMDALQERVAERLNYFSQFQTFTEEQRKQSQEDNIIFYKLLEEAEEWNDEEFVEYYGK